MFLRSNHSGGVNVGMADGGIRFINNNIAIATYRALGTAKGGEVVDQTTGAVSKSSIKDMIAKKA